MTEKGFGDAFGAAECVPENGLGGPGERSVPRSGTTVRHRILRMDAGTAHQTEDTLTTEEPLEIRLLTGIQSTPLSITMRTPGHDFELAAGFLFTEGIIRRPDQIERMEYCVGPVAEQQYNSIGIRLRPGVTVDPTHLQRHFYTTSSCGVCGKASLDALRTQVPWIIPPDSLRVTPALISQLPETLRAAQRVFDRTGGLHASGLFDATGQLISAREDVGRHNALDKLIGEQLLAGALPLHDRLLVVSGRASFELVQKAAMAGLPLIVAVGAPSSLAVEAADEFGMTLAGFARGQRFNLYTHPHRVS